MNVNVGADGILSSRERANVGLDFAIELVNPAIAFERYLNTGSGREFVRRHFRQTIKP